jgi:hypothetical protein
MMKGEGKSRSGGGGRRRDGRRSAPALFCLFTFALYALPGCATVAPEQRAILADPSMRFEAEAKHEAALRHALENREGSTGGAGVTGGGCGCN